MIPRAARRYARSLGLAVLLLLLWAAPAPAVVIDLLNGQRVEGTLRQASRVRVIVESGGQLRVFATSEIRAIYFAAPPPPAAASPGTSIPSAPPSPTTSPSPSAPPSPTTTPAVDAPSSPAASTAVPTPPTGAGNPDTPSASTMPAPPLARASSPSATEPESEVLAVVKALRAIVSAGIAAREYAAAVSDARAAVDRYLATSVSGPPPGGPELRDAVHYYQMAEFAWRNHSVASDTVWLRRDDALDRCAGYREFASEMQAKGESHYSERTRSFVLISDRVLAVLWACAADRILEAEQAFPREAKR